ncbi:MAG TPA: tol-pal system-associated acyl-CoA thioesterase [Rudaea sp.]|jgi:acyl-CoA thioester hydrolase|uniref:tol-pal system-associated acyl-CoA thioesterase n=1 Tax=Rudaea sp. TaxID=2136325 RepID=UPI002F941F97
MTPARSASPSPESLVPGPAFTWPIRVYWEDTDAGGVVYHASYLRFLERARSEWLRAQGIDQSRVRADLGIAFVVRDMSIEFLQAAKLDDELDVELEPVERRSASMTFTQCILRRSDGAVIARARVRAACVAAADFKPCRIPKTLFVENK